MDKRKSNDNKPVSQKFKPADQQMLKYIGKNLTTGDSCATYISAVEGDDGVSILTKIDAKDKSLVVEDSVTMFKNLEDDVFSSIDISSVDAVPVLVSASLKDQSKINLDLLKQYMGNKKLLQSVVIELTDIDYKDYTDKLLLVLADQSKLQDHKAELEVLDFITVKFWNEESKKYEEALCRKLKIADVEELTFNFKAPADDKDKK